MFIRTSGGGGREKRASSRLRSYASPEPVDDAVLDYPNAERLVEAKAHEADAFKEQIETKTEGAATTALQASDDYAKLLDQEKHGMTEHQKSLNEMKKRIGNKMEQNLGLTAATLSEVY